MQSLKDGAELKTATRETVRILSYLDRGGQGEVYVCLYRKRKCALKIFFGMDPPAGGKHDVELLVGEEPPHPAFIFPLVMVAAQNSGPSPGYVMPLVDTSKYVSVRDIASSQAATSFTAITTACCNFARAFRALGIKGLCYKDLNLDNLLWCPTTGAIIIIDPDNISFSGSESCISGTFGTMAPEIIRLECGPSSATDLYSLSVIIFFMLTLGGHPLEGKRESDLTLYNSPAQAKLHGLDPLYIFDPKDTSNHPVPGEHDRLLYFWAMLPAAIKRPFLESFTVGLHQPHNRLVEDVWLNALIALRDQVVRCATCNCESYYDVEGGGAKTQCGNCKQPLRPQHVLQAGEDGKQLVLLSRGSKIFSHHFNPRQITTDEVLAVVSEHPKAKSSLALQNVTDVNLRVSFADGKTAELPPKKRVLVQSGLKVVFGNGRVVVA